MIDQHQKTFFILPNGDVVVYYERRTMEAKIEFNYGKELKAHWHEIAGELSKVEIKKDSPHSAIFELPDSRVSKFHLEKINKLINARVF